MRSHDTPVLVVMGPTASGKSALATHLAQSLGGVILNADAMQCYDGLPILTAQPTEEDKKAAPHRLYGIWEPLSRGHAALWQRAAAAEIAQAQADGCLPILVGGTGMYVKLLGEGMADVPEIDPDIRMRVRAMDVAEAHAQLQVHDAIMAEKLKPGDTQRIGRALEVILSTGVSLHTWQQANPPPPVAPERFIYRYIDIPREVLYARIDRRFEQMMQMGVVEEVRNMVALRAERGNLSLPHGHKISARTDGYPLLRSHGFRELAAYLRGEMPLDEAVLKAQQYSRNYAKRQVTWIRNQLPEAALPIPYEWQDQRDKIMLQLRKIIDQ